MDQSPISATSTNNRMYVWLCYGYHWRDWLGVSCIDIHILLFYQIIWVTIITVLDKIAFTYTMIRNWCVRPITFEGVTTTCALTKKISVPRNRINNAMAVAESNVNMHLSCHYDYVKTFWFSIIWILCVNYAYTITPRFAMSIVIQLIYISNRCRIWCAVF